MKKTAVALSLLLASAVAVTPFAKNLQAQTPEAGAPASTTGPLHLDVVVTPNSPSGAPVPELPQSVFTVLDNGKPQTIDSFRAVTQGQPVKVVIVADAVNINFTRLAYERDQLNGFFKSNGGHLAEPTALAILTDTNMEVSPGFTTDGNALSQALLNNQTGLRELRRSSGFYGAEDRLGISLRGFEGLLSRLRAIPGRKVIVWVSPGWPLLSGPGVQLTGKQVNGIFQQIVDISTEMRAANVVLYSVDPLGATQGPASTFYYEEFLKGVRKPSQVYLGDLGLQVLAVQSGGLALSSSNNVTALVQRCVDDLKAYYEITYTPPPADAPNQYHEIQVKVAEPRLIARTRQGYYAQP